MPAILWAVVCGLAIASTQSEAEEQAVLLHTRGLVLAQDHDAMGALVLLREAQKLAPDDRDIAFDLARLALEAKSPMLAQDTAPFLAMPADTADAKVLRVYLLSMDNDVAGARAELDDALRLRPDHPEALLARSLLERGGPLQSHPAIFSGMVRAFTEVDSNVALLPQDAPSRLFGWRVGADALLNAAAVARDTLQWNIAADVRASFHLNDRAQLALYDTAAGTLWTTLALHFGDIHWTTDGVGTLIFAGERAPYFMSDVYLQSELRLPAGPVHVGPFVLAGDRTFRLGNRLNTVEDRDGAHFEGGALLEWQSGMWFAALRSGVVAELARGRNQQVLGNRTLALLRGSYEAWTVSALFGFEYRNYEHTNRRDYLYEPSLTASYAVNSTWRLVGSYLYVHDASLTAFAYDRQLGMLGVEARW